ncbi:MAG: hypothetical protein RSE32_13165 [Comamonas sp.]
MGNLPWQGKGHKRQLQQHEGQYPKGQTKQQSPPVAGQRLPVALDL